jgi:hypothetical protein
VMIRNLTLAARNTFNRPQPEPVEGRGRHAERVKSPILRQAQDEDFGCLETILENARLTA